MYKNFNLTDEERKQIMEQHSVYGYRKPISEQVTQNQGLAQNKGYGPVNAEYADKLFNAGFLAVTMPNKDKLSDAQKQQLAALSQPAGSQQASTQPQPTPTPTPAPGNENLYVNCAASLDEIKAGSLKILKHGCKTDAVKKLQEMLGMEARHQTGFFGNITKGKVIEFQKANKDAEGKDLVVDGKVGDKTYGALVKAKAPVDQET